MLTDPTSSDTDSDGIPDGVEINGAYGNPPQASDPRDNNTDGDAFDDGDEDANGNGIIDPGETDLPEGKTRVTRTTMVSRTGKRTSRVPNGTLQIPTLVASMMGMSGT